MGRRTQFGLDIRRRFHVVELDQNKQSPQPRQRFSLGLQQTAVRDDGSFTQGRGSHFRDQPRQHGFERLVGVGIERSGQGVRRPDPA